MRSILRLIPLLPVALSGCAFLIPPDNSVPRNNEVVGEIRRPQLNASRAAPTREPAAIAPAEGAATWVEPAPRTVANTMPDLPPVDPQTQAVANAEVSKVMEESQRRLPAENAQIQEVAYGYPQIQNVPPRPKLSGRDSAQSRLSEAKRNLEATRVRVEGDREALAQDVAAEPWMVTPVQPGVPSVTVEGAMPPSPPPAAANIPVASVPPSTQPAPVVPISTAPPIVAGSTLPAAPEFMPPAPLSSQSAAALSATVPVQPQPTSNITTGNLPPPVNAQPTHAPAPTVSAVAPQGVPVVTRGDFDPLAAANTAPAPAASAPVTVTYGNKPNAARTTNRNTKPIYVWDGYIEPSRYGNRY